MPKEVPYYDSQAAAAASLKIDIYKLRDAKGEGCPAFRSGRVYRQELLAWFEDKRLRREQVADSKRDEPKERLRAASEAMLALTRCANAGILTDDEFFESGKKIVEATGNEEMRGIFTDTIYAWLRSEYSDLPTAFTAHPEITYWIIRERLMTPEERAALPAWLPPSPAPPSGAKKARSASLWLTRA